MSEGSRVSAEDFVRHWQEAESIKQLSELLGVSTTRLSARAAHFRRKGVPLKAFERSSRGTRNDWEKLKQLAESLDQTAQPQKAEAPKPARTALRKK